MAHGKARLVSLPPEPDRLEVLAQQILELCQPRPQYEGRREIWERNVRNLVARVFSVGIGAGWDKAVASHSWQEAEREVAEARERYLAIPCPLCSASAGHPCRTWEGVPTGTHQARKEHT